MIMKTVHIFSLGLACLLSCNRPAGSTSVTFVVDRTDTTMKRLRAADVITPLTQADMWQQIHILVTSIADRDVNDTRAFNLPAEDEWTNNKDIRRARIAHLITQAQHALDSICDKTICGHSIVYRVVAKQANDLAVSTAARRLLIVCSDLTENDRANGMNFYDPRTLALLQRKPDSVRRMLSRQLPLADLTGVDIYLQYAPRNYDDNNAYMPIAHFYERMLEARGATVHIASSFLPQ